MLGFLTGKCKKVVVGLSVALLVLTSVLSVKAPKAYAEGEPDEVTVLGSDLSWDDFLRALYKGGSFRLDSDFSDIDNIYEANRDDKAALNILYYADPDDPDSYPHYTGIGPVLIVQDTVIDLAGHTIKREFKDSDDRGVHSAGMVIWVRNGATLTIRDSSTGMTGKITGGLNKGTSSKDTWTYDGITITPPKTNGGGVYVEDGLFIFESGTICNCFTSFREKNVSQGAGGGIYVAENGSVIIEEDARITNNEANSKGNQQGLGGGIYAAQGASVVVENIASVSGNAPVSANNPEINIAVDREFFEIRFVLDGTEIEIAEREEGEATLGSTIEATKVHDPSNLVYDGFLLTRASNPTLVITDNEADNVLAIPYKKLLPTATVEEVTNPATDLEVYSLANGSFTSLNKTADLGKEYIFTADQPSAEVLDFYKDWYCDYEIVFNDDVAAESFGLYGAYGSYEYAFLYPQNVSAGDSVRLLESALAGTTLTYAELLNVVSPFTCGIFNLDEDNADSTIDVRLILWPADGSAADAVVLTETEYGFDDLTELSMIAPELPTATVTDVTPAPTDVPVWDANGNDLNKLTDVAKAVMFTADDATDEQIAYYGNWKCDFAVSFSDDIAAGSIGLYGKYADYERAFAYPNAITAGEKILLMADVLNDADLCTYDYVRTSVQDFICGALNLSDDNIGTTMTIQLIMYPADGDRDDAVVICEDSYVFEEPTTIRDIAPEYPTATVISVENPSTLVPVQGTDKVVDAIGVEYKFSMDEATDEQYDYYKQWRCDYILSFSDDIANNTYGLYGAYANYDFALVGLGPITANTEYFLMKGVLGNECSYKEIYDDVQVFNCGAFNLDAANVGTQMTVRLVIWDGSLENPEYIDLCDPVTYTFGEPTTVHPATCTVTLSSVDNNNNQNVATLSGGGEYAYNEEVTVTAPEVTNYTFDGWYIAGERVATESSYTFNVTADTDLVAKYTVNDVSVNLHVDGVLYKVDDSEIQEAAGDFRKKVGTSVTVSYTGEDFLYWTNESDNIVSTSPDYTFTMASDSILKLVVSTASGSSVKVVVLNAYKQVLAEGTYEDAFDIDDFLAEVSPTKMGYTFDKWVIKGTSTEATGDAILALGEKCVEVVPTYVASESGETYTLTVKVLKGTEELTLDAYTDVSYAAGKTVRITVEDIVSDFGLEDTDEFAFWSTDGGATIASTQSQYTVVSVGGSIEVTAVFNYEGTLEAESGVSITQMYASQVDGKYILSTTMRYFVPEGCQLLETGFVYSTNSIYADALDDLVIGANGTSKHISTLTAQTGIYTFHTNAGSRNALTLYIRAYIIYTDSEGSIVTRYSDVSYGSYDTLHQ